MAITETRSYFEQRGFTDAAAAAVGWRVEPVGDRAAVYGLPADAADARVWVIPYRHPNGHVAFERIRLIEDVVLGRFGGGKYRQPSGTKLTLYDPYGVLAGDGPLDSVLLIEGEANAVAARVMVPGLAVVGLPGQGALKEQLAEQLGHVPTVFVWIDRHDRGFSHNAATIAERLRAAGVDDVRFVEDTAGMDANDTLRGFGAERGGELLGRLLDKARPLHQNVSAAQLLADVIAFVRRLVVLRSDGQATAIALWVMHTHVFSAAEASPYLAVLSPEKRCGKTLLLRVLSSLVRHPWRVITPSEAVVYRKIERDRPTLMLDEIDTIFGPSKDQEPLRALLNAGNEPDTVVSRCGGANRDQLQDFAVFCPKVLAGIGKLPDTLADRSIPIRLARKAPHEVTERYRRRVVEPQADALRERLERWAEANVDVLQAIEPHLPDSIDDRAADGWEPLLAIADLAGGEWSERARRAAVELSGAGEPEDDTPGVRLLADIRSAFADADRLTTADLLAALGALDESPWSSWGASRKMPGLTARDLGNLLRPYGVHSRTIWRPGDETAKGYLREQFEDAWARYVPSPPEISVRSSGPASEAESSRQVNRQVIRQASGQDSADLTAPDVSLTDSESGSTPHGERDLTDLTLETQVEGVAA